MAEGSTTSSDSQSENGEEVAPMVHVLVFYKSHARTCEMEKGTKKEGVVEKCHELFQDENPEDFYVKYFDSKWDSWVDVMDDWTVSEKVKLKMESKLKQQEGRTPGTSAADCLPSCSTPIGPSSKKPRLVDILKAQKKFVNKSSENCALKGPSRELPTVRLHVGWLHFNERIQEFSQVRSQKGGGVRFLSISRQAKLDELMKEVLPLFFPNEESPKGRVEDMQVSLANFQGHNIEQEDFTVEKIIERGNKTRVYLKTKKIKKEPEPPEDDTSDELPEVEWLDADTPTVSFRAQPQMNNNPVPAPTFEISNEGGSTSASDGSTSVSHPCPICIDRAKSAFIIPCGHTLCTVCALEVNEGNGQCPFCKTDIVRVSNLFL